MPQPSAGEPLTRQLKQAIDAEDLPTVKALLSAHPELHRAKMGYGGNGPLTWVAECRVPWGPPSAARLEMAQWMIANGSDVHQGGDGPLMRASLNGMRIAMMELLVRNGADVNAEWNGDFPILFAPCESVDPEALCCLLRHGARPNCARPGRTTTALDYLIGTYARSNRLAACIELLRAAGGTSRYDLPGVFDTILDRPGRLAAQLDADPALLLRRFPELDCGSTGARRLLLAGATLLHVAAEFASVECARLLLARGCPVDAPAAVDADGIGGQTPLFHAVSQFHDHGLAMAELLIGHGADLTTRVKLPGHYDTPGETVECTPLGYAMRFPGSEFGSNQRTLSLLAEHGAAE